MKTSLCFLLFFSSFLSVAGEILNTDFYQQRYQAPGLFSKITDNRGDGFEELYGTRNMRVVLKGYLYRGGGNNYYHRTNKRNNVNPLPNDGLENLCKENFSSAVYLYGTRFETAAVRTKCSSRFASQNELHYLNFQTLNSLESLKKTFALVYKSIVENKGPVYVHCWNGWHASGYTAATALIQFCDMNKEDAVRYWDANTDGNNTKPKYEKIRNRIRKFVPFPEYQLSDEMKAKLCF